MKFLYVDESGDRAQGNVFVMCGLMVDAYKLRKKTAEVSERLEQLSKRHGGPKLELKTKKFIEGKRGWSNVDGSERQRLLSDLILNAIDGGSEVFAIGISFDAFDKAVSSDLGQPFANNYWIGAAMFISSLVQKHKQKLSANKGNTVFIVDDNKHETYNFSDELCRHAPWYDGLYQRQKPVKGKRVWEPRKPSDRFDQIINTAFGIKSNNSTLVQVADAMSYVYRRHLELQGEKEKYLGERQFIGGLVSSMDDRRVTIGTVPPDSRSVEFFRQIRHPNWKL